MSCVRKVEESFLIGPYIIIWVFINYFASVLTVSYTHLFDPQTSHDIWDESDSIDTDTMDQITERYINEASKGDLEGYVKSLIDTFQKTRRALPWYFYLKKLMGKVASGYKKTTMRRNRRQPERLELSGTLRQHKANVWRCV